jgi:hypothetical protein
VQRNILSGTGTSEFTKQHDFTSKHTTSLRKVDSQILKTLQKNCNLKSQFQSHKSSSVDFTESNRTTTMGLTGFHEKKNAMEMWCICRITSPDVVADVGGVNKRGGSPCSTSSPDTGHSTTERSDPPTPTECHDGGYTGPPNVAMDTEDRRSNTSDTSPSTSPGPSPSPPGGENVMGDSTFDTNENGKHIHVHNYKLFYTLYIVLKCSNFQEQTWPQDYTHFECTQTEYLHSK